MRLSKQRKRKIKKVKKKHEKKDRVIRHEGFPKFPFPGVVENFYLLNERARGKDHMNKEKNQEM